MAITRMAECMLLMVLVMMTVLPTDGASCGPGSIRCSSSSKCIALSDLCDGSPDCPGQREDEDTAWCAMYSLHNGPCGRDSTVCGQSYNCLPWPDACKNQQCTPYTPSAEVCTAINSDLLPGKKEEPAPDTALQIDIKELVSFMSVTNCSLERTSDWTNQSSACPQLYTSIGNTCIAPLPFVESDWMLSVHLHWQDGHYTPALRVCPSQLTWPEALVACQSIAGNLMEVETVEDFAEIVQFLVKADFSSNFWIGGFYDIEKEDWAWSSGPKMPRSTPYWALKHNSTCVTRRSSTLGALPGCFHYQQAPTSQETGFCAALQIEYMYYISDEECFQKKQPLCIYSEQL